MEKINALVMHWADSAYGAAVYVRLKKKLKLSARLQLGRDSSGSVGIREGKSVWVCVCVRVGATG